MWTGKLGMRWAVAVYSLLLLACGPQKESKVDQGTPTVAWWYSINFQPKSDVAHGIDVRAIDGRWRHADALDVRGLEDRISRDDIGRFMTSHLSFSVKADLDGDGVVEEFFVGVFERASGEKGRFVAVTRGRRPIQHFEEEGSTGFSALLQGDGEVRWYKCMECGEFESIKWTGQSYALE